MRGRAIERIRSDWREKGNLAGWFNQITAAEDTRQFLTRAAFDPLPGSPDAMQALMKSDAERWRRYVELAKIKPQ